MKKKAISSLLSCSLLFSGALVSAQEQAQESSSVSGTIGLGALIINSGNNLNPKGSEERLDNLQSGADRETTVIPPILVNAVWDVGEAEGMKLYLSTTPPIDEVGGFTIDMGGSYRLPEVGIFEGSFFVSPFAKVYENPYLVGVNRIETDTTKFGAQVGLNRIMGSGLRVKFIYLNDDVDDDVIGALEPTLARDGSVYVLNMNYSFYPTDTLEIRPRAGVHFGDYDGQANSYTKYKLSLEARYTLDKLMIVPRAYYSHSDYDEQHPVFDQTRENIGYGISLMTTYMAPFNFKNWSTTALVSLSKGDSNIDFFDTEALTIGGFINYRF
ncbi:DUF2860 family protein [Desulfogranum marinum]|uniref:DUF2860 family protein n=1 Tax=Desulfogranum marinum TaxID=453220 RepID=UPI0019646618|nr:DUF2860 family protein [Desulfogranum marinum]MBM9510922.1 DUF2860 family protein [Desulfogranum marinum]